MATITIDVDANDIDLSEDERYQISASYLKSALQHLQVSLILESLSLAELENLSNALADHGYVPDGYAKVEP